jgi:hypothetical protein
MSEQNGQKRGGTANLVPFKSGAEWTGNAGGRPKGFRRLLRELMTKRELCGQEVPRGMTVEEALAEAVVMHAIKGNATALTQVLDRYDGPASASALEAAIGRVVFEIVPNHRDETPKLGSGGEDDKSGDIGENDASMNTDKIA